VTEKLKLRKNIGARTVAAMIGVDHQRVKRVTARVEKPFVGKKRVFKKKTGPRLSIYEMQYTSSPGTRQGWGSSR